VANLLLVPLTINYLDNENYGIWLTLSSFIAWFSFFDIGLGHGLRNKFAEAKADGDIELAKGYVSTAYFTIACICLVFFLLSTLISRYINWSQVFNTSDTLEGHLGILMPIVFGCFSIRLILTLITSIYTGDQNHSIQGKIGFIVATSSLFLIWILTQTSNSSLLLFGIVFSCLPILILFVLNIYAFSSRFKEYIPNRFYVKSVYFKDIFGLGITFFVIQISVIVMFSTDNLIITQLLGPKEVVPYNIAYKYMGLSSMLFTMILVPFWSSITVAYAKGDLEWIKQSMKQLVKFSIWAVIIIFIMVLIAPIVYQTWVGNLVTIPFFLTLCMAIYFVISVLYAPFNYFVNGIGKIKLHMYVYAFGAILNIPLSVFLVKYTSLGVEGVIIATIICIFPNLILFPIQYVKLINKTAKGIWNK
jgi:O-antigen/teichoic acid export membrane protein